MTLDPSITIGNLIEISAICIGGLIALLTLRNTVGNLQRDMTDMKTEIKKVGEVLIKMAVHSNRLDNVEKDIRDIKHGRGFITARSEGGVNGEYP